MNDLTNFIESYYENLDVIEILPDEEDQEAINDWYEVHDTEF